MKNSYQKSAEIVEENNWTKEKIGPVFASKWMTSHKKSTLKLRGFWTGYWGNWLASKLILSWFRIINFLPFQNVNLYDHVATGWPFQTALCLQNVGESQSGAFLPLSMQTVHGMNNNWTRGENSGKPNVWFSRLHKWITKREGNTNKKTGETNIFSW